ncbi:hypothetical protein GYB22_01575 [bacterium]|nr:hypothetical protein [bacterium]
MIKSLPEFPVTKNKLWNFIINGSTLYMVLIFMVLGAVVSQTGKFVLIGVFHLLLLNYFLANKADKRIILPNLLIMLVPFELFGRMVGANPFIPWELGKYLGIPLLIHGMLTITSVKKGGIGLVVILLSIPGLLLAFTTGAGFGDIVFNYMGIFNLGLCAIYFTNCKLTKGQIIQVYRTFIVVSCMVLIYIIIKTPDLSKIDFELGANFKVTGGFGSNQVATVLGTAFGLGIFIWMVQYSLFKIKILNLILPSIFLLWAVLSFSRGGVITSLIALLLIVFFTSKGKGLFKVRKIDPVLVFSLSIITVGLAYFANEVTQGQLFLRYQGETYGTYHANQEKDLSTLTTSRSDIFFSDLKVWQDNFWFGVGAGKSPEVRGSLGYDDQIAHVEVSRLLSEHGFLGLVIVLIILLIPVFRYFRVSGAFHKAFIIMCFTIAILTSMHSAMRTYTTPFFFGFAFVSLASTQNISSNSNKKISFDQSTISGQST